MFGCLYFYVSDQLRRFVDRLSSFHISIKVCNMEAMELSRALASSRLLSLGLSANVRFDRIEVSNVIDEEYIGIVKIVHAWGTLLKKDRDATLVGYFMNWARGRPEADPITGGDTKELVDKLVQKGRVSPFLSPLNLQMT